MSAVRWFILRHPKEFLKDDFRRVEAAAEVWACTLNAIFARADRLRPSLVVPEDWMPYSVQTSLSDDGQVVTVAVGRP